MMDVIAGRKTQGEITGDILVNGYPKDQTTWARVVGYVEQMDIHSPQVTVLCTSCNSKSVLRPLGQLVSISPGIFNVSVVALGPTCC